MLGLANGLEYPNLMGETIIESVDVHREGWIQGVSNANHTTARTMADPGQVDDTISSGSKTLSYYYTTARGTHRFSRIYLHFKPGAHTLGTTTALSLKLETGVGVAQDIQVIKSTAFNGDGGTALSPLEYFSDLSYQASDTYTASAISLSGSSLNTILLNANAVTEWNNSGGDFGCAVIVDAGDYDNTAATSDTTGVNTIDFDTTVQMQITYEA